MTLFVNKKTFTFVSITIMITWQLLEHLPRPLPMPLPPQLQLMLLLLLQMQVFSALGPVK